MDDWRVVLLGDSGVGKTALAVQTYEPTIIEDAYRKQLVVDNQMCLVEIIDTAGQGDSEEYATLRDQWVRECQGVILVYSIASRSTFDQLGNLFTQCMRGDTTRVIMLVGNKCDKTYEREVSKEEGAALAHQFGCEFIETSARTAQNSLHMVEDIVRALRRTRNTEPRVQKKRKKSKLSDCIIM